MNGLPALYPITPLGPMDAAWWMAFTSGLGRGYSLVQLRVRNEPETRWRSVMEQAADLCGALGCKVMLNLPVRSDPAGKGNVPGADGLGEAIAWVEEFGFAGIHVPAAAFKALGVNPFLREPAANRRLLAASCHSPAELQHAERIGADWVCLSPVRPTSSHPGAPALGMDTFRDWTSACRLPVYGLGGLGPEDLGLVRAAGGQGVAGISAFWS